MQWLVQRSIYNKDDKVMKLVENLDKLNTPYFLAQAIPFSEDGIIYENEKQPDPSLPCFTYGSYTLAHISKKYFKPGAFISERLTMGYLLENYRSELFNPDMQIVKFKDAKFNEPSFIRPNLDSKSFVGGVMTPKEFIQWQAQINILAEGLCYARITPETEIIIAKEKPIHQEIRFFIVNDKIATYSQYKLGGELNTSGTVDQYVLDYVNDMIKQVEIEKAYCFDIAVTDGVPKILETNCINASGLYALDTQKFIMAVEELDIT